MRGAEGESDFFQDAVPTTLDDQEEDPIQPAHEETAFKLLRHATDRQESSQSNECEGEHVIKFSKALPKVILKNKILAA